MHRIQSFLLLNLLMGCLAAQGILPGIITFQNSGNKPVPGAIVRASLANSTETAADGTFTMTLPGKAPGYEVVVRVEKPGYEVVNRTELERYALRADASQRLKIWMCPVGQWERNALAYYQINEKKITLSYQQRIDRLKLELSGQQQLLQDSLATLAEQHQLALNQAEELANRFAIANLDDASLMFRQAFDYYTQGEIDSALQVLDEVRLDELAAAALEERAEADTLEQLAAAKRDTATKTLAEVVEGYALRAQMLITKLRFDEGFRNFEKAVALDSLDFELNFEYASFLQKQNRFRLATAQYEKVLKLGKDSAQTAMALNNIGAALRDQNDYARGVPALEEALKISRKLAQANEAVYLPDVAKTLHNLGNAYTDQNDYARGIPAYEEALRILRKFAETNEAVYLRDVAATLNCLGAAWINQHDYARGVPALEETLKIGRKLAQANEAVYLPDVATTLVNLGLAFTDQNDYTQGVPAYEEALKIFRGLAENNPEVYLPSVARTRNNLGTAYINQNDYAQGIPALEEVLKIFRKLAETNEAAYLPGVAATLNNLGSAYQAQNDYARAMPAYEEALNICRKLAETNPEVYLLRVALMLNNIGAALTDQNNYARGVPAYEEALKISRNLAETNESVYLPYAAAILNNLGNALTDQNNYARGIPAYEEALKIRRDLAETNPEVYLQGVAGTLNNLGYALMDQHDYSRAIPDFQEALIIYRNLAESNPEVYLDEVARTLNNLGKSLFQQGKMEEARLYAQEAADIRSRFAQQEVSVFGVETAASLSLLGQIYDQTRQVSSRDSCWHAAQQWLDRSPETAGKEEVQNTLNQLRQAASQPPQQEEDPLTKMRSTIQEITSYAEKVRLQQVLIEYVQTDSDQETGQVRTLLSQQYGNLSWYALFTQDYSLAESSARKALELDSEAQFAYTNLAHALLFQGKYKEAEAIYQRFAGQPYPDDSRTWSEVFLSDLAELEAADAIPAERMKDVEQIRKRLKK
ncbi:MAG: tetratricopeptide repeat protein [Bacteroidia bacterium]|nr:tetratricopeptide repeat protein [Bacteroidia bacterium]